MSAFELYLRTLKPLDQVATLVASALAAGRCEHRYGENRGGDYFQIEVFGLDLELMKNAGQVKIPERSGWPYYMVITARKLPVDSVTLKTLSNHIAFLVTQAGLEAEIDELS